MSVSCDPIIRYTLSKKRATKVKKVNKINKIAISSSTFIEIETNEIQKREIQGERKLEKDYLFTQIPARVRVHVSLD